MRHGCQDPFEDEAGGGLDVSLVAGRTEPAALAGEGQQVLVVAADAGEAACQVAASQEFVDHLGNNGAQVTEAGVGICRGRLAGTRQSDGECTATVETFLGCGHDRLAYSKVAEGPDAGRSEPPSGFGAIELKNNWLYEQ